MSTFVILSVLQDSDENYGAFVVDGPKKAIVHRDNIASITEAFGRNIEALGTLSKERRTVVTLFEAEDQCFNAEVPVRTVVQHVGATGDLEDDAGAKDAAPEFATVESVVRGNRRLFVENSIQDIVSQLNLSDEDMARLTK
ncbi:hypothetical protein ACXIUT_19800 [Achromobacter denitrificans]|jgi:hypothetical protein